MKALIIFSLLVQSMFSGISFAPLVFVGTCLAPVLLASPCQANWKEQVEKLASSVARDEDGLRESLIADIAKVRPDFDELISKLEKPPEPRVEGGLKLYHNECMDGVKRPYCLYLPRRDSRSEARPLFVYLHGGVNRKEIVSKPMDFAKNCPFLNLCKKNAWYLLLPFAAFVALNGHMGVASLDGDLPTYANNLAMTPIYAVTTHGDFLYPTEKMKPSIAMVQDLGAPVFYRSLPGKHSPDYLSEEVDRIEEFLMGNPRNSLLSRLDWEAADLDYSRFSFLEIKELDPSRPKALWHRDSNVVMVSDRITIGFHEDRSFKGKGDKVASLAKGQTVARKMGLRAGDVILRGGEMEKRSSSGLEFQNPNITIYSSAKDLLAG